MKTQNLTSLLRETGTGFTRLSVPVQLAIVFGVIVFFMLGAAVLPWPFGIAMQLTAWISVIAIILHAT